MITIPKRVAVDQRYKEFLKLVSASTSTGLSDREIDILDAFFWISEGVITTDSRKKVAESLEITDFNLNNMLGKLRKKDVIHVPAGKEKEQIRENMLCDLEADKTELTIAFKFVS